MGWINMDVLENERTRITPTFLSLDRWEHDTLGENGKLCRSRGDGSVGSQWKQELCFEHMTGKMHEVFKCWYHQSNKVCGSADNRWDHRWGKKKLCHHISMVLNTTTSIEPPNGVECSWGQERAWDWGLVFPGVKGRELQICWERPMK